MPNQIDSSGIQVKTLPEIIADLTTAFTTIYGSDINLDQSSPDGQLLNQIALMILDVGDFIVQDYNSKDPDLAVGVALDGLAQLCGITREGGTYTQVTVTITTDRAVNLSGLDTSTPFTVSDSVGNQFALITSASLTTGANTLSFQSVAIGDVQISLNTLTVIVTPVLGVLSSNNPSAPTQQGADQETDAQFRLRRQSAVALPAQGSMAGLVAGLNTLDNVIETVVYENTTNAVDADGIPAHGIWVIVDGGDDEEIGAMIYLYRPLGIPMLGAETVTITQVDTSTIDMKFDYVTEEDLYIELDVSSKSGGSVDDSALATFLESLTFTINEIADISTVINKIYDYSTDVVVNSAGVSLTASGYTATVEPSTIDNKFTITSANVDITVT